MLKNIQKNNDQEQKGENMLMHSRKIKGEKINELHE